MSANKSTIRILRSSNAVVPSALAEGELAISMADGGYASHGGRVYIGVPEALKDSDVDGAHGSIGGKSYQVIGGKYFTDMLRHQAGTATANGALILDGNKGVDELTVGSVKTSTNTLEVLAGGGDLVLTPEAGNNIDVSTAKIVNLATPTADADATTKAYVDGLIQQSQSGSTLTVIDETGTQDSINLFTDSLTITGDSDVETTLDPATGTMTISLNTTGVVAGTYGNASKIPVLTVDANGRVDSVGTVDVAGVTGVTYDSATGEVTISTADNNTHTATVTLDPFSTTNLVEGDNLYYTKARVDSDVDQGFADRSTTDLVEGDNLYYTDARADSAAKSAIGVNFEGGDGAASYDSATGVISITGPSDAEVKAHFKSSTSIEFDSATGEFRTSGGGSFTDLTVSGDLIVNGTQTILNTEVVSVEDPMIQLGNQNPADTLDMGFIGKHDSGTYTGLFRDASDGTYKLFDGLTAHNDSDNDVDVLGAGFTLADMAMGNLTASTVTGYLESLNGQLDSALSAIDQTNAALTWTDNGDGTFEIKTVKATETQLGVATFDGTNFTVTDGDVAANNITFNVGNDVDGAAANGTWDRTLGGSLDINYVAHSGVTANANNDGVIELNTVAAATADSDAANMQRGTAVFDANNFQVTANGFVTVNVVDGGSF